MGGSLRRFEFPMEDARREADLFGKYAAQEELEKESARLATAMSRESIDPGEAQWLLANVGASGPLEENEKALLAFIRKNAPQIDPALNPLLERAGV